MSNSKLPMNIFNHVEDNTFINSCMIRNQKIKVALCKATLKDVLLYFYKKNKKEVIYSYPLNNQLTVNSIFERMLSGITFLDTIIITDDFKFFLGFDECKALYRWIFKGYPLYIKDNVLRWSDLSDEWREEILTTECFIELYHGINGHEMNNIFFNTKVKLMKEN